MSKWWDKIADVINQKRCVLFLGSGISANATKKEFDPVTNAGVTKHPATWKRFLESGAEKIGDSGKEKNVKKYVTEYNYLLACELLRNYLGEGEFNKHVSNCFRGFEPSDVHKNIQKLGVRIIVSPNIDDIYETYAKTITKGSVVVKQYCDPDLSLAIREQDDIILKIHGSIDNTDKWIFTSSQYAKARVEYSDFYQLLSALLLTHTFIFLGAGLDDPDIKLLLENHSFQFRCAKKHLFVIPDNTYEEDVLKIYQDQYNLDFVKYDNTKGDHSAFVNGISDLAGEIYN